MKSISLIGVALVLIGSFLPLVYIPFIGDWKFWDVHPVLAIICWLLSILGFLSIILRKNKYTIAVGLLLIFLFSFSLYGIKFQSEEFFSFLIFDQWIKGASKIVEIKWGWMVEYLGAVLIITGGFINNQTSTKNI